MGLLTDLAVVFSDDITRDSDGENAENESEKDRASKQK